MQWGVKRFLSRGCYTRLAMSKKKTRNGPLVHFISFPGREAWGRWGERQILLQSKWHQCNSKVSNESHLKVPETFQQTPDMQSRRIDEIRNQRVQAWGGANEMQERGSDLTPVDAVFSASGLFLRTRHLHFSDMMSQKGWICQSALEPITLVTGWGI